MADIKFDTFISYRRSDGSRIAKRLRDRLVSYELPKGFTDREQKLCIYLDEIYEIATEDFFEHTIKPALAASRSLVVVQTPDAPQLREDGSANWVEKEIEYFRSLPGKRPVWIALGKGEFGDPLPATLHKNFPNVERVDVRGLDRWFGSISEHELVKFVGPLFDISIEKLPSLRREEERKASSRRNRILVTATLLVVALSALAASSLLGWSRANDRLRKRIANGTLR